MFRYRVYDTEGEELGEAAYAQRIFPGETVWLSGARMVQVVSVVDTPDSDLYEGLLSVEAA